MPKVKIADVFKIGKAPKDQKVIENIVHPLTPGKKVRCVLQKNEMFFNVADFLKPYKNPSYETAIRVCIPESRANLTMIWIAARAWDAIAKVVMKKYKKEKLQLEVKKGVTMGTLFPDQPPIKKDKL